MIGMQVFAFREVQTHRRAAAAAAKVSAQVEMLQQAGQILVPLYIEFTATDGVSQAAAQGIERDALSAITSVDYLGLVRTARVDLDAGLDELVARWPNQLLANGNTLGVEMADIRAELVEVRAGFDVEAIDVTVADSVFERLIALLNEVNNQSREVFDTSASTNELVRLGNETGQLLDALGYATQELHLFAETGIANGDTSKVVSALQAAGALDGSLVQLRNMLSPERRAALDVVTDSVSFKEVNASLPAWATSMERVEITGVPVIEDSDTVRAIVNLLTSSFARLEVLQKYAANFLEEEVQIANDVRTRASNARHNAIIVMIASIAISLLLLGLLLLSILRPLRRLVRQSRQVGDGDLALAPMKPTGPTDIRVVMRTFNEMVTTLRAYDAQVRRLALGETQIDRTLPGPLGDTLRQSVSHLAAVTSRLHASEAAANLQARTDALTGLANRTAALEQLARLSMQARLDHASSAVVFLDLDGFKSVNDTQGHAEGDRILGEIGGRLRAACPDKLVARIGGDEFIVLVDNVTDQDEVMQLAHHLIDIVSAPCSGSGGQLFTISASAGVAMVDGAREPLDSIAQADSAVYHAKESGRGRVEVYNERLAREIEDRADMALTMRQALLNDQFSLKLQPIIDIATKEPVGAEALLRWNRPGIGEVGPAEFIPIAERTGVILDIDAWVLEHAVDILKDWQHDRLTAGLRVAVNISGRHIIDGTLSPLLRTLCDRAGVNPAMLDLEITETHLVADVARASAVVDDLRRQGVKVAIDDFGTGYSSMGYLHQLTVDTLKIDRVFVAGMCDNTLDRTIVELLLRLGDSLGLKVVAEGVDSEQKLNELAALGCPWAQGFYIARPMPISDATTWLRQQVTLASLL